MSLQAAKSRRQKVGEKTVKGRKPIYVVINMLEGCLLIKHLYFFSEKCHLNFLAFFSYVLLRVSQGLLNFLSAWPIIECLSSLVFVFSFFIVFHVSCCIFCLKRVAKCVFNRHVQFCKKENIFKIHNSWSPLSQTLMFELVDILYLKLLLVLYMEISFIQLLKYFDKNHKDI